MVNQKQKLKKEAKNTEYGNTVLLEQKTKENTAGNC